MFPFFALNRNVRFYSNLKTNIHAIESNKFPYFNFKSFSLCIAWFLNKIYLWNRIDNATSLIHNYNNISNDGCDDIDSYTGFFNAGG